MCHNIVKRCSNCDKYEDQFPVHCPAYDPVLDWCHSADTYGGHVIHADNTCWPYMVWTIGNQQTTVSKHEIQELASVCAECHGHNVPIEGRIVDLSGTLTHLVFNINDIHAAPYRKLLGRFCTTPHNEKEVDWQIFSDPRCLAKKCIDKDCNKSQCITNGCVHHGSVRTFELAETWPQSIRDNYFKHREWLSRPSLVQDAKRMAIATNQPVEYNLRESLGRVAPIPTPPPEFMSSIAAFSQYAASSSTAQHGIGGDTVQGLYPQSLVVAHPAPIQNVAPPSGLYHYNTGPHAGVFYYDATPHGGVLYHHAGPIPHVNGEGCNHMMGNGLAYPPAQAYSGSQTISVGVENPQPANLYSDADFEEAEQACIQTALGDFARNSTAVENANQMGEGQQMTSNDLVGVGQQFDDILQGQGQDLLAGPTGLEQTHNTTLMQPAQGQNQINSTAEELSVFERLLAEFEQIPLPQESLPQHNQQTNAKSNVTPAALVQDISDELPALEDLNWADFGLEDGELTNLSLDHMVFPS